MKKVLIKDKEYELPTSWDDVSCKKFITLFEGIDKEDLANEETRVKTMFLLIARLTEMEIEDLLDLSVIEANDLVGVCSFLNDVPSKASDSPYLILGEDKYYIPEPSKMTFRQLIDAESFTSDDSSSFLHVFAALLIKEREAYDGDKHNLIYNKLLEAPISTVLPYLNDFFLRKKSLQKSLQRCFQKIEKLKSTLQNG